MIFAKFAKEVFWILIGKEIEKDGLALASKRIFARWRGPERPRCVKRIFSLKRGFFVETIASKASPQGFLPVQVFLHLRVKVGQGLHV